MNNYAFFIAATPNYLPYLNAFLNSVEKCKLYEKCDLTVYVMYHDWPEKGYIERIKTGFSYKVETIEIMLDDFPEMAKAKRIEFIKRTRYKRMGELGGEYDAVALFDCDMFIVSDQFISLLDMVKGTDLLIGCNEKIKWHIGSSYTLRGKPLLEKSQKLMQFICNVPSIFDMTKWRHVVECYCDIAANGRQLKGNKLVGIGDLFCWSLAIQKMGMNDKVVMFPIETMAQVHHTMMRAWTYPVLEQDYWRTQAGDRIYTIHGRVARENMVEGCIAKYRQLHEGRPDIAKLETFVRKGLKAVQKAWYELNYNSKVSLEEFYEKPLYFEDFKGE